MNQDHKDTRQTVRLLNSLGLDLKLTKQGDTLRFEFNGKTMSVWLPFSHAKAWADGFLIGAGLKRHIKK